MGAAKDLVSGEGVDEGSADATAEAVGSAGGAAGQEVGTADVSESVSAASPGPTAAEVPDRRAGGDGGSGGATPDLLGEPPHGAPVDDVQAAGPVDMESEESRRARAEQGSGQQLQAGEG